MSCSIRKHCALVSGSSAQPLGDSNRMIDKRRLLAAALAAMTLIVGPLARAQSFPDARITMMVGFGAGGMTDVTSRILAAKLEKLLGVTVIVENKGGAGGTR